MRDSRQSWNCRRLLAVLACMLTSQSNTVLQADDAQLDVIRAGYGESLSKLQTLYVRCEKSVAFTEDAGDLRETVSLPEGKHAIEWALDGSRMLFSMQPLQPGENTLRDSLSNDGQSFWNVEFEGDQPKIVFQKNASQTTNKWFRERRGPGHFLGLYIDRGGEMGTQSLRQLLQSPSASLEGREVISGVDCWKVKLGSSPAQDSEVQLAAWFDPQAGYLPREIRFWSTDADRSEERPRSRSYCRVESFLPVPEIDGWFPGVMVMESWLVRETFEVQELIVNRKLPAQKFRPAAAADVRTVNLSDPKDNDEYDRELVATAMRESEAARRADTSKAEFALAVPPAPGSLSRRWLTWVGAVCLFVGLCVYLSQRRRLRGAGD